MKTLVCVCTKNPAGLFAIALCSTLLSVTPVHSADKPAPVSLTYFGMHIHRATSGTQWPNVPFGSWRLWDARVAWPNLEPKQGQWDFRSLDEMIALSQSKGVQVLLPLGLSPQWASARPTEASAYQSPGWAAEPRDLEHWRDYVRTIVRRYRGRVSHYEIWNEPNLKRFFSGTTEAMVALTCTAYRAAKEADPAALIVSPAATEKAKGAVWLNEFLSKGGGSCIDIVGFHFYTLAHEPPEAMLETITEVRDAMRANGQGAKPLWNTESGWYIENKRVPTGVKWRVLRQEEAQGYVVRALTIAASAGVERFFWYAWDNKNMGGMIEPDTGEPKPIAAGYSAAVRWIAGSTIGKCAALANSSVWACPLNRDKKSGWLVWTTERGVSFVPPKEWAAASYFTVTEPSRPSLLEVASSAVPVGATPVLITSTRDPW